MNNIYKLFDDVKVIDEDRFKAYSSSLYGSLEVKSKDGVLCVDKREFRSLSAIFIGVFFTFFIEDAPQLLRFLGALYTTHSFLSAIIVEIRCVQLLRIIKKLNDGHMHEKD